MKNNRPVLILVSLFIILAVYNVIVFLLPFPRTSSFWTAYAFSTAAFVLTALLSFTSLGMDKDRTSLFLGLSILNLAEICLVLQTLWGFVVMFFLPITPAVAAVFSVILLAGCLGAVLFTSAGLQAVQKTDQHIQEKVNFIRMNQALVESLLGRAAAPELKKSLSALRDQLRFSDPLSHASLAALENEISAGIRELTNQLSADDTAQAAQTIQEISRQIVERNGLCKILK